MVKKDFLVIGLICAFLAGFSDQSQAQNDKRLVIKSESQSLIQKIDCTLLSNADGAKSVIVDGVVVSTDVDRPVGDAFRKEGYDRQLVNFVIRLKEMNNKSDKPDFYAYTRSETSKSLELKAAYMLVGKHYSFCAHKVERKPSLSEGLPVYEIDSAETITEVK